MKKFVAISTLAMLLSMAPYAIPNNANEMAVPSVALAQENNAAQITADGFGAFPAGRPLSQAKMMARRAAIMDAQRNLLEAVKGTSVDAESTMNNFVLESDVVRTKISGVITGARVISEGMTEDGGYRVTMSVPAYGVGPVGEVAITKKLEKEGITKPEPIQAPPKEAVKAYVPAPEAKITGGYTGVVIDAKGSALSRTFCPVIYDTNGRAIYGVKNVTMDYAISKGVVEYAEGADRWQQVGIGNSRAGSNPLIVKMVSLRERCVNKCDVVISVDDANKILIENQKTQILEKYSVVFEK